jgi:hypothetical protein
MNVEEKRRRVKEKRWIDCVIQDLKEMDVSDVMTTDSEE